MSSGETTALVARLRDAALGYSVRAECILEGESFWAGTQHYLDVSTFLTEAADALAALSHERDTLLSHSGQCSQCGTFTCGYCGISDEDGRWHCEKCRGTGPLIEAIKRAEAAEHERDTLQAEREHYRVQVEERYGSVAQWRNEAETNRQAWLKAEAAVAQLHAERDETQRDIALVCLFARKYSKSERSDVGEAITRLRAFASSTPGAPR